MLSAAFGLLFFAAPAAALTVDAVVGFDGHYVPGRWTPLSVTVENLPQADKSRQELSDFDGMVRVVAAGVAGESAPMAFTRTLAVPAGDRKRITLYARFPAGGDSVDVELVSRSGRRMESVRVPRKAVPAGQPLVAWFRTTDASIALPKMADLPAVQMASLDPAQLPDRWYGYDGVSLLVIPRMLDKLLDRERAEALHKWVAQGGRLLLVGGRHGTSYQDSPVEDMLPGTLRDSDSFVLGPDGLTPAAAGETTAATPLVQINRLELTSGSQVHLESNSVPLLSGRTFGSGRVFYLTSDWSPRLFQHVPVAKFLTTWLYTSSTFQGAGNRLDDTFPYGDSQIFGLGKASALPDVRLVGTLLISYLLLVGPANFFVLARRKRLELAWITVPVIVTVFCGVIYALGSSIRGSGSFLRSYHLVTGRTGSSTARAETFSLVYLSQKRYDKLTPTAPDAAAAGHTVWVNTNRNLLRWNQSGAAPPASRDTVQVTQGPEGMALDPKLIRQWAYDFSRFDSVTDLQGTVEGEVVLTGNEAAVTVRNATGQPLRDLHVVIGGRAWRIALPEGEERRLEPGDGRTQKISLDTGGKALRELTDAGSGEELDRRIFGAFASTLAATDPLRPDLPPAFLIGRLERPPLEIDIQGGAGIRSSHSFFALEMPVRSELPGRIVQSAAAGRYLGDIASSSVMQEGRVFVGQSPAVFATALPVPLGTGSSRTRLEISWGRQTLQDIPIEAEVFDFAAWEWRPVPLEGTSRERPAVSNPDPFSTMHSSNELASARADLSPIAAPTHPMTGGMLIKLGRRKDADSRSGLDVAPPVIHEFTTGSPTRSGT